MQNVIDLLAAAEVATLDEATGLAIVVRDVMGEVIHAIGPYSKDDADVFTVVERLRAEQDPEEPCTFDVCPLFPPSFAIA